MEPNKLMPKYAAPLNDPETIEVVYPDGSKEEFIVVRLFRPGGDGDWIHRRSALVRELVPGWFNYLEWVLVIGVIEYARLQTSSYLLLALSSLSSLAIWRYYIAVFGRYYFADLPFAKNHRVGTLWTTLLSLVFAGCAFALARYIAAHLPR